MNICLVNNLYPPINTGSSFYTKGLANNLSKRGHKVIVITNQVESKKILEIENDVKIYRLPVKRLPKLDVWMKFPDFNFSLTPKNFRSMKKILTYEEIQIIHQCNNIFDLVFFSSYFSRKFKIPLLCSIMTQIQHTNKFYNKILELFDKTVIRYLFSKNVSQYIALDKESIRYINERFKIFNKVLFVPYLIPQEDIDTSFNNRKNNYNKTYYRMLSLGHISNLKNRFETIKAWRYVVNRIPKAKLVIVGGIFSKKSEKLIKDLKIEKNIELTGRIPHSDIYKYINNSDFSCMFLSENLPYHKGIGGANFEIMASGLPVVLDATDNFFGNNFPFKDGKHYIRAKSRDPKYLSEIFIELFKNLQLRKKVGIAGQQFVRKVLAWDKIVDKLETLYYEVTNKRNNK
jgi:glycosyltransferase involved in cell wall biosynthesis